MGLYDELVDSKREEKSGTISGVVTGIVKKNYDKEHLGCVMVDYSMANSSNSQSEWIRVMMPYAGNAYGVFILPEVGSEVVISFEYGNPSNPIIIGCLYNSKNKFPSETVNKDNSIKKIKTKGGSEIIIDETDKKEKIEIKTKNKVSILLDDKNDKILIKDKKGDNSIEMDGKGGKLTLKAKKNINLNVGGKKAIDITSSGVKIDGNSIKVNAKQSAEIKGQSTKIEGATLDIKGKASVKVTASGMLQLKGSMTKIN